MKRISKKSKVCRAAPNFGVGRKVIRKRSRFVRRGATGKGLLQDSTSPVAYSTVKELCAVLVGEELSCACLLGSQMWERPGKAPGETMQGECVELLFLQEEQAR